MTYDPKPMPGEHVMQFSRWQIYSNYLRLTFSYNHCVFSRGQLRSGFFRQSGTMYRFSGYAPDVTAPIDFSTSAMTVIDSGFFLPAGPSRPAVAQIIFDPEDPPVTWGGPLITLRIAVPDAFFQVDFTVKLPADTDPTRLDGRVNQI
jgi:hypothetical protein